MPNIPSPGDKLRSVTVVEATIGQKAVVDRLMQLYLHEFSEFAPIDSAYGEVDHEGRFANEWLDSYWQEPERIPLLIRADDRLAGFALVNRWSPLGRSVDRVMAEFFVLRKYRRAHVGMQAALLLFRRYPGRWEIPVADDPHSALLFWRRTTEAVAPEKVEEHHGDGKRWSGTVLCLETEATA
jgi:predicted acetyltransferase